LIEGVGEMVLPCSFGLVVPGLLALLLAKRSALAAVVTLAVVAALTAWARAAGFVDDVPIALLVVLVPVAVLVLRRDRPASEAVGGGLLGVVAGATWMPCVGEQLGVILTTAPREPLAQLVPLTVYVVGVLAVVIALALLPVLAAPVDRHRGHRAVVGVGVALAAVVTVALAAGRYTDVLATFAQIGTR
jgi:cytochrome c biogenesis protein CcdA